MDVRALMEHTVHRQGSGEGVPALGPDWSLRTTVLLEGKGGDK